MIINSFLAWRPLSGYRITGQFICEISFIVSREVLQGLADCSSLALVTGALPEQSFRALIDSG